MTIQTLEPLVDRVREIRTIGGRFDVQLEIPEESTLLEEDIRKILKASSWAVHPDQLAIDRVGGRAIVAGREKSIYKGKLKLDGLQVAGIGYDPACKVAFRKGGLIVHGAQKLQPPSKEDFMHYVSGDKFGTGWMENGEMHSARRPYSPLGTYEEFELVGLVHNTRKVHSLKLKDLLAPHVEAYGRYLNSELRTDKGPFGFVVFPIPLKKRRAGEEILRRYAQFMVYMPTQKGRLTVSDMMNYLAEIAFDYIKPLIKPLRELHDKGYAHLQTHVGNFYSVDGLAYLMDWQTLHSTGNSPFDRRANRLFDLDKPGISVSKLVQRLFEKEASSIAVYLFEFIIRSKVLAEYLQEDPKKIVKSLTDFSDFLGDHGRKYVGDDTLMEAVLKENGIR